MRDDKNRVVKIGVVFGVVTLILLSGLVALGSVEVARIRETVYEQSDQIAKLSKELNTLSKKSVTVEDLASLQLPKPVDGKDGKDGKDSHSTTTVIERQTVIEKEVPGVDGKDGNDGQEIEVGQTLSGQLLYKYKNDRVWLNIPVINLGIPLP